MEPTAYVANVIDYCFAVSCVFQTRKYKIAYTNWALAEGDFHPDYRIESSRKEINLARERDQSVRSLAIEQ